MEPLNLEEGEIFSVDDRVMHPIFGEGTVLSVQKIASDVLYQVEFDNVGKKKIMRSFAKMKKLI